VFCLTVNFVLESGIFLFLKSMAPLFFVMLVRTEGVILACLNVEFKDGTKIFANGFVLGESGEMIRPAFDGRLITDIRDPGEVTLVGLLPSKGVQVTLALELREVEEVMRDAVNVNFGPFE
jgi:hypothetical protein